MIATSSLKVAIFTTKITSQISLLITNLTWGKI